MSNGFWALIATIALWSVVLTAALTDNPVGLILLAYVAIGFFAARNTLLRMKAYRRDQGYRYELDLDGSDIAFVVIMAGVLWPLGWLTSFAVYPALWTHKRRKRVPHDWSRLNEWADRKLAKEDA